jgi:hypothetical protein
MKEIWLAVIPSTIPTLAVLVGILLNQVGISRLEAEMSTLRKQFHEDILMLV